MVYQVLKQAVCGRESTFVSEVKMLDVYFWAVRVPALLISYCLMYIFLLDVSFTMLVLNITQLNRQIMDMQQVLKLLCSLPKEV